MTLTRTRYALDKLEELIKNDPELNRKNELIWQAYRDILVYGAAEVSDPEVAEAMIKAGFNVAKEIL